MAPEPPAVTDLPDAELDVLAWLWRNGPSTARQVREGLSRQRPMTDGASVTLLRRLEAKGLLTRRKERGQPYLYRPTRSPRPTYRRLVRNLAERLFGGDPAQLVLSLFEGRPPTDEELEKIERAIHELRKNRR